MKKPEKFWDRLAKIESKKTLNKELGSNKVYELCERYLESDDVVLDFGCGPGGMSFRMANRVKNVLGIDFSSQTIQNANNRNLNMQVKNVSFRNISIFDKSLKNETFDVVTAFYVFHVVEQPEKVIERIVELLKPGGLFISATVSMGEKKGLLVKLLYLLNKLGLGPNINAYKVSELLDLMGSSCLEIIDNEKLSDSFSEYFIVSKKV